MRVVNCSVRVPRVLCAGITRASSVFNAAVHESGTVVFEEKLSTDYLRLVWSKFRHKDSSHNYGKSAFCASVLANSAVISKYYSPPSSQRETIRLPIIKEETS